MRAGMATMLFNLESLTPEPLMDLLAPVKAVGWVTGVFGAEKSFAANPIIGSPRLNRLGLHRRRVATAAAMAARRRRAMAEGVPAEDREAFDRDGFVIKRDYLPADIFARPLVQAAVLLPLQASRIVRITQPTTKTGMRATCTRLSGGPRVVKDMKPGFSCSSMVSRFSIVSLIPTGPSKHVPQNLQSPL